MLSLIVCSINPGYLESLKESVTATIGVDHEWLIWDNRSENRSICYVYNKLGSAARYPYLVFLHEDLIFKTQDWGRYIADQLGKKHIGLIGIAGSTYKSKLYSGWYSGGGARDFSNIYHRQGVEEFHLSIPDHWEKTEVNVVTVDGVFMACQRDVWETVRFDEELLKGFHFYDIDFSLRVARSHRVVVTNAIAMIHITVGGDFGNKWVEEAIIFHESAKQTLPFSTSPLDYPKADKRVAIYWLDWLKNYDISWHNRLRWIRNQKLHTDPRLWYAIIKFLLYRALRLKYVHYLFKKRKTS